jgi:hypothetical protein
MYDVLHEGDRVGTFTVGAVADVGGTWIADGKVKPLAPEKAPSEINLGKSRTPKRSDDDEDKPPILRRPDSTPPGTPPGNTPSTSAPDNPPPQTAPNPQTKPADTQTDKSADDADRPTLKRGKPEPMPEAATEPSPAAPPSTKGKPASAAKTEQSALVKETYTAISDASTTEYRPYDYAMSPQDRERFTRDLTGMALEALSHFSSTHSTAGVPVPGPLQNVKLAVYDLDLNNMPTIVLTATKPATPRGAKENVQPLAALEMYVTVVARTDIYGNIRRIFAQVTDASHLDLIPRLELIDAVDAEATGRGQLLFRQIGEANSRGFALYRVGADQLWPLFEANR